MQEYVFKETRLKEAHIVDEELLLCLQKALKDKNGFTELYVVLNCSNEVQYNFSNIEELLSVSKEKIFYIKSLSIKAKYKDRDIGRTDSVDVVFFNDKHRAFFEASCTILYQFHNEESFYYLKNKIEAIIKNQKPEYSLLSRTPLTWILVLSFLVFIHLYTWENNILFPKIVQDAIYALSWLLCMLPFFPFATKIKYTLFPRSDFKFGLLANKSKKVAAFRSFIWKGIILALAIGIVSNILSGAFL